MIFFFFSSRRRHTRWTGDWSSDVCSSDLRELVSFCQDESPIYYIEGGAAPSGTTSSVFEIPIGKNSQALSAVDADRTDLTWHGLSIDKLEGMDLYNSAGKKIGEVEDVLADGSGQLSAVGVGFGGPLGADDDTEVTEVVVPLDRLRLSQDGHLTGDLSESDLAQLPEWDN